MEVTKPLPAGLETKFAAGFCRELRSFSLFVNMARRGKVCLQKVLPNQGWLQPPKLSGKVASQVLILVKPDRTYPVIKQISLPLCGEINPLDSMRKVFGL